MNDTSEKIIKSGKPEGTIFIPRPHLERRWEEFILFPDFWWEGVRKLASKSKLQKKRKKLLLTRNDLVIALFTCNYTRSLNIKSRLTSASFCYPQSQLRRQPCNGPWKLEKKENQSKATKHNQVKWPAEANCFLVLPLRWLTEVKNVTVDWAPMIWFRL